MIYVDDIPIAFDRSFISLPLDDAFIGQVGERFVYEIIRERRLPVTNVKYLIDAAPASEDAQREFGLPNGYPTLRRSYHFVAGAVPIRVYGVAISPFDRVVCSLEAPGTIRT